MRPRILRGYCESLRRLRAAHRPGPAIFGRACRQCLPRNRVVLLPSVSRSRRRLLRSRGGAPQEPPLEPFKELITLVLIRKCKSVLYGLEQPLRLSKQAEPEVLTSTEVRFLFAQDLQ